MNTYRFTTRPSCPIAPPSGRLPFHRIVLFEKIGYGPHRCHWCGIHIVWAVGRGNTSNSLVADHIDTDRSNNDPANLVQSCVACNQRRTSPKIIPDEVRMGYGERGAQKQCEQCHKTFLAQIRPSRPNRGRCCSNSCARRYEHAQKRLAHTA